MFLESTRASSKVASSRARRSRSNSRGVVVVGVPAGPPVSGSAAAAACHDQRKLNAVGLDVTDGIQLLARGVDYSHDAHDDRSQGFARKSDGPRRIYSRSFAAQAL